jgi:uncharacterized protein YdcH (DUF465 family)
MSTVSNADSPFSNDLLNQQPMDSSEVFTIDHFKQLLSEKDAEIQRLTEERNAVSLDWYKAEKEIQRLQDWKESAMAVWPDMQKIGELIGVKLGGSVHDKIIPAIEKLQAEIQHLKSQRVKDIEDAIDFVHTNMGTLCDYDEFLKAKSEYLKPFTAEVNNKK